MTKKIGKIKKYSKKRSKLVKVSSKKTATMKKPLLRQSYTVKNDNIVSVVSISPNGKVTVTSKNLTTGKIERSCKVRCAKKRKRKPSTEGPGPGYVPERR